jgi:hypothetical protein
LGRRYFKLHFIEREPQFQDAEFLTSMEMMNAENRNLNPSSSMFFPTLLISYPQLRNEEQVGKETYYKEAAIGGEVYIVGLLFNPMVLVFLTV